MKAGEKEREKAGEMWFDRTKDGLYRIYNLK